MINNLKKLIEKYQKPSIVSLLIVLVFFLPHFYAFVFTPDGLVFTGQASWFDPWDINVYVAAIKWSQEFGLHFQNSYTTLPHEPVILYPLYTFLGIVFSNPNPWLIYHLSKIVLGIAFVLTMYKVSFFFLKDRGRSLLSVILASLGGGFGWAFYERVYVPDISYTPFTFTSSFERPHELLALIFYLLALYFFYKSVITKKTKDTIKSALSAAFFTIFYPYYLSSYYLISLIFLFISKDKSVKNHIKHFTTILTITLPVGLFFSIYFFSAASFENVLTPNLPTPHPVLLVLGYGILTPILLYQLFFLRKKGTKIIFLNIWFFVSIFLAHTPLGFSRYFLRGLFFPGVLITLLGLEEVSRQIKIDSSILKNILIITLPITGLFLVLLRIATISTGDNTWVYLSKNERQVIEYLETKTPAGSGVMVNSYPFANYLPTQTHNRVYFGHPFQTPNSKEKIKLMRKFYQNKLSEVNARHFLKTNNIKYVLKANVKHKNYSFIEGVPEYSFLEKIYSDPNTTIYKTAN